MWREGYNQFFLLLYRCHIIHETMEWIFQKLYWSSLLYTFFPHYSVTFWSFKLSVTFSANKQKKTWSFKILKFENYDWHKTWVNMSGIDFILTSLCVNITCDFIRLEKSPVQADWLIQNCITNETCKNYQLPKPTDVVFNTVESNFSSSLELKGFYNRFVVAKLLKIK